MKRSKPTEKGSAPVAMVESVYTKEAQRQLKGNRFYTKLNRFNSNLYGKMSKSNKMYGNDHITLEYLNPEEPKPGRFHLLQRIHKVKIQVDLWYLLTATQNISEFVNFHLRPHVERLPYFI